MSDSDKNYFSEIEVREDQGSKRGCPWIRLPAKLPSTLVCLEVRGSVVQRCRE